MDPHRGKLQNGKPHPFHLLRAARGRGVLHGLHWQGQVVLPIAPVDQRAFLEVEEQVNPALGPLPDKRDSPLAARLFQSVVDSLHKRLALGPCHFGQER
jgi:hypothetical protein